MLYRLAVILGILVISTLPALSAQAKNRRSIPCFVPGKDCIAVVVNTIEAAQSQLLIQAYGFTSCPIIRAIGAAKNRNLDVRVLLDKSNEQARYAGNIAYLRMQGIDPLIDDVPGIAHRKIVIADSYTVLSGSMNFTESAQKRNVEHLLVTRGKRLARDYIRDWQERETVSRTAKIADNTKAKCLSSAARTRRDNPAE